MARLQGEWRWLAPFLIMAGVLFVTGQVLGSMFAAHPFMIISQYALRITMLFPIVLLCSVAVFFVRLAARKEESPLRAMAAFARSRFATPGSAWAVPVAVCTIPILMGSFGTLKMMMTHVRPFTWDAALAAADRALFFGVDPWRLTHALLGPAATRVIDTVYTFWVAMLMIAVIIAAVSAPATRARFFLSFAAGWLLIGTVGAYALASAGPCYAGQLGLETAPWFQPLMAELVRKSDMVGGLGAVGWQEVLWKAHEKQVYSFASGISAAPSMHNAMCMLYILTTWNAGRALRLASIAFAAVIFVGSIHLGWHYAVDGIMGAVLMVVVWKGVNGYLERVGYVRAGGDGDDEDFQPSAPDFAPEPAVA